MSTEQRDEINARRRAADKKKKEDQIKNLTTEQMEDMYARKSQPVNLKRDGNNIGNTAKS